MQTAVAGRIRGGHWMMDESDTVTQPKIRRRIAADFRLLLAGTELQLSSVVPGRAMDYEKMKYTEKVELGQAMSYIAKLVKCTR